MILPCGFQQFVVGGRRSINSIQAVNTPAGAHLCELMIEFSPEFRRTIFSSANLFLNLSQPVRLIDQTLDRIAFFIKLLIHLDAFSLASKLSRLFVQLVASAAGFLEVFLSRRELFQSLCWIRRDDRQLRQFFLQLTNSFPWLMAGLQKSQAAKFVADCIFALLQLINLCCQFTTAARQLGVLISRNTGVLTSGGEFGIAIEKLRNPARTIVLSEHQGTTFAHIPKSIQNLPTLMSQRKSVDILGHLIRAERRQLLQFTNTHRKDVGVNFFAGSGQKVGNGLFFVDPFRTAGKTQFAASFEFRSPMKSPGSTSVFTS